MMKGLTRLILSILLMIPLVLCGQDDDATGKKKKKKKADRLEKQAQNAYYGEKVIDYQTKIFDDQIKTLILHTTASELAPPIINLNGNEKLILRFDDLSVDMRDMYYSFEHCTFDWKPSDLQQMDFQTGFNSDFIANYELSFNTVTNYTHYQLEFPNDRINLTASGNYIIKVFANNNPEDIILTARFMIVEPGSNIVANVRPSGVVSERDYRQEIDLEVSLGNVPTSNPYGDIELVVLQNFRWDNMKTGVKPSFIKDNKLIYDYQGALTFDGMHEFHFFDAKSARYRSEQVLSVDLQKDGYHLYLAPVIPEPFLNYSYRDDINGRFLIRNDDMIDPHLESDYFHIHFQVAVDAILGNGDLYLMGQLSYWQLNKDFRMTYNPNDLVYEKTLLLKQGYYNYMPVWRYAKSNSGVTDLIDGNHSEAENEYVVLVYLRDRSAFYDKLIGYKLFSNYEN